ncbi:MAG: hypothetical protein EPN99_14640 [Frankiales bacterium]|nr:MAG: hypothetical protein EPN99_14640 [Frankiales bacterium]
MTSPSYCAPCISDLALVRDAVTSVAGTAACMAHAVLLTHTTDDPGRRRHRLDALKDLASSKAETAEPAEQVKLELLVQEYGLAGAMDMGAPARSRGPQQQRHGGGQGGVPSAPGEGRKSRRGRQRPDRPERPGQPGQQRRPEEGETAPVTPAPGPAGDGAPVEAVTAAVDASAPSAPSGEQTTPAAPQPAADPAPAPERPAPEHVTPAAPQPEPAAQPESGAPAAVPPTSDPDA